MRAFMKGHRSGSSQSDISHIEIEGLIKSGHGQETPVSSPMIAEESDFISPSNKTGNRNKNTPKRLLLPIKNLFSSPGSTRGNNQVLDSGDMLNNMVFGTSSGKHKVKKKSSSSSISYAVDKQSLESSKVRSFMSPVDLNSVALGSMPQVEIENKLIDIHSEQKSREKNYLNSKGLNNLAIKNSKSGNSRLENDLPKTRTAALLSPSMSSNSYSSTKSHSKLMSENKDRANDRSFLSDDEDSETGSNSSQFSFLKTKDGGRSTSIKYYKSSKKHNNASNIDVSNFITDDFDYDAVSDYDYENNGIDDEINLVDFEDEEVPYKSIFESEEIIKPQIYISSAEEPIGENVDLKLDEGDSSRRLFNKSYHLSIDGIDESTTSSLKNNSLASQFSDEDVLENYYDLHKANDVCDEESDFVRSTTPEITSPGNLELFDVCSPLINGLTIGSNLRHRIRGIRSSDARNHSSAEVNKNFIHRETSVGRSNPLLYDSRNITSPPNELKIFRMRVIKSFHGSLDEDLNESIPQKVEELEKWKYAQSFNQKEKQKEPLVGLGISYDEISLDSDRTKLNQHDNYQDNFINISANPGDMSQPGLGDPFENNKTNSSRKELFTLLDNIDQKKDSRFAASAKSDVSTALGDTDNSDKKYNIDNASKRHERRSITNMMDKLASLESSGNIEEKNKRKTIMEMMNTLERLDRPIKNDKRNSGSVSKLVEDEQSEREDQVKVKMEQKSWQGRDENVAAISYNVESEDSNNSKEENMHRKSLADFYEYGFQYDRELLDEVNEIPLDFDPDSFVNLSDENRNAPTYMRSNSFKNKPLRVALTNSYTSNRIETPNKTVTIYRSSSLGKEPEWSGSSWNISRVQSLRSVGSSVLSSYTDVDNPAKQEDTDEKISPTRNYPYDFRQNIALPEPSLDSLTNSFNLDTISEADSPHIR